MSILSVTKTKRLRQEETPAVVGSQEVSVASAAPAKKRRFRRLLRYWVLALTYRLLPLDYPFLKRLIDITGSALLLVLLLPLFAVVAALIKLSDGGPVLFWQMRVGRWGRAFGMPKFRSMVPEAERLLPALLERNDHKDGVVFKMKADPRVTWIGRFIRKFSIDELPQLWCVLKGDMSLVGPRPPVPREVAHYSLRDRLRLDILPGLTCIWQVSGRSLIPFSRQVEMDIEYAETQCFWLDIKLLFKTIPTVLFPEGAY
jgi:lipopolysaccharide/colanic/teichoic acid biosynthesis glycosyltransferase